MRGAALPRGRVVLVALAAGVLVAHTGAMTARAQRVGDAVRVRAGTALRALPGGEVVGVSSREIAARVESAQFGAVKVTVRGFVPASLVTVERNGGRGTVAGSSGATVRASAARGGDAVAEFRRGAFLFPDDGARLSASRDGWLTVRRSIWVDTSRVRLGGTVAAARARPPERPFEPDAVPDTIAPAPATAAGQPTAAAADAATLETAGTVTLHAGPTGAPIGSLIGGTTLTPLARQGGWVRVRLEGWLPDSSAVPVGARPSRSLSAADLRADPAGTRGRVVRWDVEALAFQRADGLRRGLVEGEAYLLARGPAEERALLYLAIPDSLVTAAQGLPPLTPLAVTARVRDGRSEPAGVPVLEVLGLVRR